MSVLVIGCEGQVGTALMKTIPDVRGISRKDCDLQDRIKLRDIIHSIKPTAIVNAAAYTAVDKAETDPLRARLINAILPGDLALECMLRCIPFIHYSTDYVFSGTKDGPYVETDKPDPRNVYGWTKLIGEAEALSLKATVLRTSWIFSETGSNFVKTILRLAAEKLTLRVVDDQRGCPTSACYLAEVTASILLQGNHWSRGLYHVACAGDTSWFGFAQQIIAFAKRRGVQLTTETVEPIPTAQYPLPASRPANSVLDCRKLTEDFGIIAPHWMAELTKVLDSILGQSNVPKLSQ